MNRPFAPLLTVLVALTLGTELGNAQTSSAIGWHIVSPALDLSAPRQFVATPKGGYIISDGFVAHSTDFGATWSRYDIPNCLTAHAGAFSGDTLGIVVGKSGSIFKTTNGGVTWVQRPTDVTALNFRSVVMVNPSLIYASGTFGLLAKSTDGGDTWTYPGAAQLNSFKAVGYVKAVSADQLYLMQASRYFVITSAGTDKYWQLDLLYSSDGGDNWSSRGGPWIYGPIEGEDEAVDTGFARDLTSLSVCNEHALSLYIRGRTSWVHWTSTDAGLRWDSSLVAENSPMRFPRMFDCQSGWATDFHGKNLYRRTASGGSTWMVKSTRFPNGTSYQYDFTDTLNGYCLAQVPWTAYVLRTTDGGANWNTMYQSDVNPSSTMTAASFISPSVGWATGNDDLVGSVLQTIDGGLTWNTLWRDSSNFKLHGLQFTSATRGWAWGDSVVSTNDGGRTWIVERQLPLDPLRPSVAYPRLQFLDAQHGWAVRSDMLMYRTSDGGAHWLLAHQRDTAVTINLVEAFDASSLFALGTVSDVVNEFKISDDGASTQQSEIYHDGNAPGIPSQMFFLDSLNGWFTDDAPNMYRTTDGGGEWTFLSSDLDEQPPRGLYFRDTSEGWLLKGTRYLGGAMISGPSIVALQENGATGVRDQCLFQQLNAMTFLGDTLAWAVGDHFTVYKLYAPTQSIIRRTPKMALSRPLIDFGMVKPSTVKHDTLKVYNPGNADLHILGATVLDDINQSFHIAFLQTVTIPPGDSVVFDIVFDPKYYTTYSGSLYIYSDADTQHIALRGLGDVIENGVNGSIVTVAGIQLRTAPNPFSRTTTLTLNSATGIPAGTSLKIYDAIGREIADLTEQIRSGGKEVVFDSAPFPSGRYLASLQTPAGRAMQALLIVR